MKKIKEEKGITLVALIITIVVLLILAVVSIGAVQDSDIIGHAQDAAGAHSGAKDNELDTLGEYEALLEDQQLTGKWRLQKDGTVKNKETGVIKNIGDTFTNDEVLALTGGTKNSYTGTWTILGLEDGYLKLVSSTEVGRAKIGKDDSNVPAGLKEIYNRSGENNLNIEKAIWSFQNIYKTLDTEVQTKTGIQNSRSITIKDIEENLNITNEKKEELEQLYGETNKYSYDEGKTGIFINQNGEVVILDAPGEEVTLITNNYDYPNAFASGNPLATGQYIVASQFYNGGNGEWEFGLVTLGSLRGVGVLNWSGWVASCSEYGVRAIVYV